MNRFWRRLVAAGIAPSIVVLGLTGCGSSSKGSISTTTAAPSGTTAQSGTTAVSGAPTGAPLVVGLECSCSGPYASAFTTQQPIINAWVAYENAKGGVDGRPVKVDFMDDGTNPGTSLAQVTKLVQDDHAIAIMDASFVDSAWSTFVQQHGVPVIGNLLSSALMYSNSDFFPEGQTIDTVSGAVAAGAKKEGVTSLGVVYCTADAVCASFGKAIQQAAVAAGLKGPFALKIPDAAPNYTASCIAAKQGGADGMFVAGASTQWEAFVASCSAQSYTPKYIAESGAVVNGMLNIPAFNGLLTIQNNLPAEDTSSPAIQTMIDAVNKYSPGTVSSPGWGPFSTSEWAAGLLFADAAQAGHVGSNPTSAALLTGLYSLKGDTLGGLAPPLTFKQGQPTSVNCWFYLSIKNGQYTPLYGNGSFCGSSSS